jgi:hypothetical protein
MNVSEIARIRQCIDQEIAALKHAKGFAVTARHEMITTRLERLGACMEELSLESGLEAAARLIIDQLEEGL